MEARKEWEERISEFKESGESQREWCGKQGIKRSSLRYWLERLEELEEGKEVRFAELRMGGGKG